MFPLSYPPEYYKLTLRLLQSLCGSWGVLPASYTFQREVSALGELAFFRSCSAEVFSGMSGEEMVAVKAFTICPSDDPNSPNKVGIASKPSTISVRQTEHRIVVV